MKAWIKRHPHVRRVLLWNVRLLGPIFPVVSLAAVPKYVSFIFDLFKFRRLGGKAPIFDFYPCLFDKTFTTRVDHHYFYQAIWAFKRILESGTKKHVDVGSDAKFVGMLTTITDVTFVDIRPLKLPLERFSSKEGSILALPFSNGSISSLSSLHVIEHIGLGRYGDQIDPDGSRKAIKELLRVLAIGGDLYISCPIGKSRVYFNAHRVHTPQQIIGGLPSLSLVSFSVVDDVGNFYPDVSPNCWDGLEYGCGFFHFKNSGFVGDKMVVGV